MVKLKLLVVLIVAVISIKNKAELKNDQCSTKSVTFFNDKDTLILNTGDYKMKVNVRGFDLVILDRLKLEKLMKLDAPEVMFCFHDKMNIAKGIDILSSFQPNQADYFFGLDSKKKITIMKGNVLNFSHVRE